MGKRRRARERGDKSNPLRAAAIFLGLLVALVLFMMPRGSPVEWRVTPDGLIEYPSKRGRIDCQRTAMESGDDYILDKVVYESKGLKIYGLLRIPKSVERVPGIVLLPGAQVTKEGEQNLARTLQRLGYATLALDQRGHGETNGYVASIEEDFFSFSRGIEPVQHKMIYDALRAIDCMRSFDELDENRIYVGGESMGGRFAIIAGAIDQDIVGVLAISTSGYRLPTGLDREQLRFITSIDPNAYISMISPRKLIMIHSKNDKVVPIEDALATFKKAREPKAFYTIDAETHGYHRDMDVYLAREFGSR
jgi:hypothetical protein